MEDIINYLKNFKPLLRFVIFIAIFTISFMVIFATLKYTIPFIIGIIAAAILKKPTEYLIKKFNMEGNVAAVISTLIFYAITITMLVFGIVFFCSEIKDLASDGYDYIYRTSSDIGLFVQDFLSKFDSVDKTVIDGLKDNITQLISDFSNYVLDFSKEIVNYVISIISALPYIISVIIFAILSSFVFLKKFIGEKSDFIKSRHEEYDKYFKIIIEIKDVIFKYVGTYSFLVFCTFVITFIGFSLVKIPYTLLLSLTCMILDVLPIVGMVLVFLPPVAFYLFTGKIITAFFLVVLFCVIMITRNVLEPKLLSASLELSPLSVLISIFVGLNIAGFKGMIYLLALFIGLNFYKKYYNGNLEKQNVKGWFL